MRVATFNVQNLRLRRGADGEARLDGARDGDWPPHGSTGTDIDRADRRLTAAILHEIDADIVALQEVHDRETLDFFHDTYLTATGLAPYPHRFCIPGNDGMGRNIALLSRLAPERLTSHASLRPADLGLSPAPGQPPDRPVFCRDCVEAVFASLTLYLSHFKAPYPDRAAASAFRRTEALATRRLVERRFADPASAAWLILGDLNEPDARVPKPEQSIAPLVDGFAVDLLERRPQGQRWSYHEARRGLYSRPDALLASPALAERFPDAVPRLIREGMSQAAGRYPGPRLHGVGRHRPHASDHAAIMVDFVGL
ncbi:endonuclease/exonuclease/phosphatase family protein [Tropicimonas sp. IMCC6043]|uniref:endonuclease/exonuclease/phosphatase family protein n=1 Tax=Tropicimonas sp. IMCC6043 TaxID=2510645 RepID=UPI00101DE905|nr:endonuclease/exonuclease/phosphatase family protein [Tropicimonas sp. IMCC6043]RYH07428.1 endonuclease/exonuclease/phosphatase family protein [Tropicimonas sp. IMCC6043]